MPSGAASGADFGVIPTGRGSRGLHGDNRSRLGVTAASARSRRFGAPASTIMPVDHRIGSCHTVESLLV